MKINVIDEKNLKFKDLKVGQVFLSSNNGTVLTKINNNDVVGLYNSYNLEINSLECLYSDEPVIVPSELNVIL